MAVVRSKASRVRTRRPALVIGVVILVAVGLAQATVPARAGKTKASAASISVVLGSPVPNPFNAELYVMEQEGFLKDEGVTVDYVFQNGALAAVSALQAGRVDMMAALADSLPAAKNAGADIVAVLQRDYSLSFSMFFLKDSKYQNMKSLKGARIGVSAFSSAAVPTLETALVKAGLKIGDVELVPIGTANTGAAAIASHRVDAAIFSTYDAPRVEALGVQFKVFDLPKYLGLKGNSVGSVFATNRSTLNDPSKRDAMVRLLRAYTRAKKFCAKSIPNCVASFVANTNDKTPTANLAGIRTYAASMLASPPAALGRAGWMRSLYWDNFMNAQLQARVLEKKPPAASLFTNALTKQYNAGSCGQYVPVRIAAVGSREAAAELWIAQGEGLFANESLRVQLSSSSRAAALSKIANGQLDLALVPAGKLPAGVVSVYQSTYRPGGGLVFVTSSRILSTKRNTLERALRAFTFGRTLSMLNKKDFATSFKSAAKSTKSVTRLQTELGGRATRLPAGSSGTIGFDAGLSNKQLLAAANKGVC